MGRNSFAMAEDPDWFVGNYEYQVLTHAAPQRHPKESNRLTFAFVTGGVQSAVARAKAAAGSKDVTMIGAASTTRQVLEPGLADGLHIDIMPIVLCGGLRFCDRLDTEAIRLERLKVMELSGGRPHMRFRIIK